MKIILLGSTGFIGKAVLHSCLNNVAITSVVALSRRQLPEAATNPKLTVVILEDFMLYPDSVLEHFRDADSCIWSIGTYNWDTVVELEYPKAFQKALLKAVDANRTKSFRYVYLGGAFTEQDQDKALWFFAEGRRVRGLAEIQFLEFGRQNHIVETYVVKPGGVLGTRYGTALLQCVLSPFLPVVRVDGLAAVMVDLAENGGPEQVVPHEAIGRNNLV